MNEAHPKSGRCTKRRKDGQPCRANALAGLDACRRHCGMDPAAAKAKGAVVAEVRRWGLGDSTVEPGEVMLRLVSQSAARCEHYAHLLAEAYDAAERLRVAHEAEQIVLIEAETRTGFTASGDTYDRPEHVAKATARADLRRIFATGGIAALVGNTYTSTKDGDIFATGEAIRGLAKLEADERDRCANFAAKAVAAGIAERQVRLAERQADLLAGVIRSVLADLDLNAEQQAKVATVVPMHLRAVAAIA